MSEDSPSESWISTSRRNTFSGNRAEIDDTGGARRIERRSQRSVAWESILENEENRTQLARVSLFELVNEDLSERDEPDDLYMSHRSETSSSRVDGKKKARADIRVYRGRSARDAFAVRGSERKKLAEHGVDLLIVNLANLVRPIHESSLEDAV